MTQLGQHIEARNAFNQAMTALDFVPKLSPEKKESIIRDIHALVAEIGMGLRQELSIYFSNFSSKIRLSISSYVGYVAIY